MCLVPETPTKKNVCFTWMTPNHYKLYTWKNRWNSPFPSNINWLALGCRAVRISNVVGPGDFQNGGNQAILAFDRQAETAMLRDAPRVFAQRAKGTDFFTEKSGSLVKIRVNLTAMNSYGQRVAT